MLRGGGQVHVRAQSFPDPVAAVWPAAGTAAAILSNAAAATDIIRVFVVFLEEAISKNNSIFPLFRFPSWSNSPAVGSLMLCSRNASLLKNVL